ncbi:MAG: hypothetical protein J6Q67_06395, partial [Clostridia bacterium]|nr:hypothetical protein [Clostridia bacterium]
KKTEKMRVFTPEQNSAADAYKFDYRIYYDVFVKESAADAIWVWESPKILEIHTGTSVKGTAGSEDLILTAHAMIDSPDDIITEWYQCDDKYGRGARKLPEIGDYCHAAQQLPKGTYYFYCKKILENITTVRGDVLTVEVL